MVALPLSALLTISGFIIFSAGISAGVVVGFMIGRAGRA